MKSPNRRQRGNIDTLPSGALRVRVYNGRDPITNRPFYLTETISAGTPKIDKVAQQALTRLLNQVDEQRASRTHATVGELIDAYLEVVDIDRRTMRGWRSKVENHIRPLLGPKPIEKTVTAVVVFEKFYAELRRCRTHCDKRPQIDHRTARPHDCDHRCGPHQCEGLGASSVREIHAILSGAFRRAVAWGWTGVNPLDQVTPPEAPKPNPQPPKPSEAARLVNEAWRVDPDWGTYLWDAMTSGKRRSELCGLRFPDVDLETETLQFGLAVKQDGKDLYEGVPKGGRFTRVVMDPETTEVMREHLERCAARAAAAGVELDPEGYVFSNALDHSTPWKPDAVTQRFSRLRDRLGIKTSLHKLRHYNATELIAAGVDVATVAGRLGHASKSTTLNHYTAWISEADQRAAHTLAPRLPPRPQTLDRSDRAKISPESPYEVIAAGLRDAIKAGEFHPGEPIPTEKELAAEHEVSAGTAHRVVELLKSWGLVHASRGKRTTVRSSDDLTRVFEADAALKISAETPQPTASSESADGEARDGEDLELDILCLGRSVQKVRTFADPNNTRQMLQLLTDVLHRLGDQVGSVNDYEMVVRYAGERAAIATLVAPDGIVPDALPRPDQQSVRSQGQRPVHGTVRGPVQEPGGRAEQTARTGPDQHSPTTGPEALDLELTHLGRRVRTYRTHADPTNSDELLHVLRDAIRRTGGQNADVGDYELVVRYARERGVLTTVVAPPRLPETLVGVA